MKFWSLVEKASRRVRAAVALKRVEMHVISSTAYGDQNAQTNCSCGWKSDSFSGGKFYTWEARWDMASAAAHRHLCQAGVVKSGKH